MQRHSRVLVSALLSSLGLFLYHAHSKGSANTSAVSATTAGHVSPAVANNAPPVITLAAIADVQVGEEFEYLPWAQDRDRDSVRFTAVNLPPWANIDAATGRIRGTPGANDEGLYESISITVADATHKVVTAPFSITVNPAGESVEIPEAIPTPEAGTGIASLQWEMPLSKVSGEPLDDLAGYRILFGRNSSDLDQSVMIEDPATTSYQFTNLGSGIWYFEVVAFSSNGLEGPPTTLTSKSI
jgi:hypothetical protein